MVHINGVASHTLATARPHIILSGLPSAGSADKLEVLGTCPDTPNRERQSEFKVNTYRSEYMLQCMMNTQKQRHMSPENHKRHPHG